MSKVTTAPHEVIEAPLPPPAAREILDGLFGLFKPGRENRLSDQEFSDILSRARDTSGGQIVVHRLLLDDPHAKAALADLYCKYLAEHSDSPLRPLRNSTEDRIYCIFLESGSTLLYVANKLRYLGDFNPLNTLHGGTPPLSPPSSHPHLHLYTNNSLAAPLFLTAQDDGPPYRVAPYLFAGYLELKYEGLFPFFSSVPTSNDELGSKRLESERLGYAQCRMHLAECDLLLLAASRLSLIYGPTVGSRENAMFKNACYNACVPPLERASTKGLHSTREIHLLVTAKKLILHASSKEGFHTVEEEFDNKINKTQECFPLFDVQPREVTRVVRHPKNPTRSPFDYLAQERTTPLQDGTRAVQLGDGRFRICDQWSDFFLKAGLTVKVFLTYEPDYEDIIKSEVLAAGDAWDGIAFNWEPSSKLGKEPERYVLPLSLEWPGGTRRGKEYHLGRITIKPKV